MVADVRALLSANKSQQHDQIKRPRTACRAPGAYVMQLTVRRSAAREDRVNPPYTLILRAPCAALLKQCRKPREAIGNINFSPPPKQRENRLSRAALLIRTRHTLNIQQTEGRGAWPAADEAARLARRSGAANGAGRNTSISKPLKRTAKHASASGKPPDKSGENAGGRRITAAEKTVCVLDNYEESKWRLPPGLGSADPRTRRREAVSPSGVRETSPHPQINPAAMETPPLTRSVVKRRDREGEIGWRRAGTPERAARRGLPRTGARSDGKSWSESGSRRVAW
ncbi:hypothetical protein NDU88_001083 [Pleurodeles waltl]|uniref:Uncharacterized protein n=1 Tax=Pleurodeles waltl TaxID=8319 RepID=A0AAV7SY98_PLEWA|nr:hypothetical protein NDU88_001083 [Pleurodeles waltl]